MAKRGKKSGKKRAVRKSAPRAASGSGLEGMSVGDLHAELRRRQRGVSKLERRRERLMADLDDLNAQIANLGGSLSGRGGRRNAMTLPDSLYHVLQGKTMSVTDAAEAVRIAGYTSNATNFRTMVNQALLRDDRFKKISRGQYTAS